MYCKDCAFFNIGTGWNGFGSCDNEVNFHFGYKMTENKNIINSGAIIESDEGWGWYVGENFGCVHFKKIEGKNEI